MPALKAPGTSTIRTATGGWSGAGRPLGALVGAATAVAALPVVGAGAAPTVGAGAALAAAGVDAAPVGAGAALPPVVGAPQATTPSRAAAPSTIPSERSGRMPPSPSVSPPRRTLARL